MLVRSLLVPLSLFAFALGGAAFASDQGDKDDEPAARQMPLMRCVTLYSDMERAVETMEIANRDMEDAWNSGDLDEVGKASGRYDEAAREYNEREEKYDGGDCFERTGKPPPDAPKKWDPSN